MKLIEKSLRCAVFGRLSYGSMHRFEYKAYRRSFSKAFANAREEFAHREGIWLRVEDESGRVGFGEAAPLPSFGTESFLAALGAVEAIGGQFDARELLPQLGAYPSLLWGMESALAALESEGVVAELGDPWPVCALVGDLQDFERVEEALALGYRCLKFKIGVRGFEQERGDLERVVGMTGDACSIRLDANASLSTRSTVQWLEAVASLPVEFIEQPLEVGAEGEMARLAAGFPTALALDESVCAVDDLRRWRDAQWSGVFVVKPSLAGSRQALKRALAEGPCDIVFSTALETRIGATSALSLALQVASPRRALGFGADSLFADKNFGMDLGSFLQSDSLPCTDTLELLWNQI